MWGSQPHGWVWSVVLDLSWHKAPEKIKSVRPSTHPSIHCWFSHFYAQFVFEFDTWSSSVALHASSNTSRSIDGNKAFPKHLKSVSHVSFCRYSSSLLILLFHFGHETQAGGGKRGWHLTSPKKYFQKSCFTFFNIKLVSSKLMLLNVSFPLPVCVCVCVCTHEREWVHHLKLKSRAGLWSEGSPLMSWSRQSFDADLLRGSWEIKSGRWDSKNDL